MSNETECRTCGRDLEELPVIDGTTGRTIRTEPGCAPCLDSMADDIYGESECIVDGNKDGVTLWDCPCRECRDLRAEVS